jgi:predicted dehydrogenase
VTMIPGRGRERKRGERLRVAVIGLGVGEQHIGGYLRHPGCELVALCDLSEEKLAAARAKYPKVRVTTEAREVLEDPGIQVVSIATYDDVHADQVLQALRAGKHVFVEKPLCQTMDQLREIRDAWRAGGGSLKLDCNLVLRASPLYHWLKEQVREGALGRIYAFDGEYLYGRIEKITGGWRRDVQAYSVMAGGGIHLIDLMLWLTGERPGMVMAAGNRICTEGTAFQYPDYVSSLMQSGSGMVSRITANFGCVHRHQHVLRVFGTGGTFLYDDAGPRVHRSRDPEGRAEPVGLSPFPETKGDLIPAFVDAILYDKDISAETQMIFDGIAISLACDRALVSRTQEMIEYL